MAYTTEQLELKAYLEAAKAKTLAWVAEDPENRWAGYATTDIDHWIEQGINSVREYELDNMRSTIWDLYKDVHGIRPRWMNIDEMSEEELTSTYDRLLVELEESNKREAEMQADAIKKFEAKLEELIAIGAGDRETALRWYREADNDEQYMYDDGYFEYCNGLPYGYMKEAA